MKICIHGDIAKICKEHGIAPTEIYTGKLSEYNGTCCVVVTDSDISLKEYYKLRAEFKVRGIKLISTRHEDKDEPKKIRRQPFGWCVKKGMIVEDAHKMEVAHKILELYDQGWNPRQIESRGDITDPYTGSNLSAGTIRTIILNRERYENEKRN